MVSDDGRIIFFARGAGIIFFWKDGKSFAEFLLEGKNMYKTRQKD
jgi:hypothetical protein